MKQILTMEAADLKLLSKHELIGMSEIEFIVAGGVRRVEFKQLSEGVGNQLDGRGRKQIEKQLFVFYVSDPGESAAKRYGETWMYVRELWSKTMPLKRKLSQVNNERGALHWRRNYL